MKLSPLTFYTRFSIDRKITFVVDPRNNFHHWHVDGWILYIYIQALIWIKKLVSLESKELGGETSSQTVVKTYS